MPEKKSIQFILASASPRRSELLSKAGYNFTVVKPDIDESAFPTDKIAPTKYAEELALSKAKNVASKYPDDFVLAADTIVDFHGQIIGKPLDANDARKITTRLFSSPHKVITGLAILRLSDKTEILTSASTTVYPKKMTPDNIAEHIRGGSWQDKAGAYAIQENGDEFVEKIDGSLTNVMGLPMELVEKLLKGLIKK